jgi:hypothetical protein
LKSPSNKILILSAICLSLIASIGAYKIGEARKVINESSRKNAAVYVDIKKTNADTLALQEALNKIQLEATLNPSEDANPFGPKESDTLTDTLAKNIFLSYAERESGKSTDDDAAIAGSVIGGIDTSALPQPTFSLNDVRLFVPQTKEDIKRYGNEAGGVIKQYYTLMTMPKYSDGDLRKLSVIHQRIGQELIKIKVPAALSQSHMNLANSYVVFGDSIGLMATEEQRDPLKALLSMRTAKDSSESMTTATIEINTYLKQNDILYSENEAGLIWEKLISEEQ